MKDIVYSIPEFLWIANVGSDTGRIVILFGLFDSSMVLEKIYFKFSLVLALLLYFFQPRSALRQTSLSALKVGVYHGLAGL